MAVETQCVSLHNLDRRLATASGRYARCERHCRQLCVAHRTREWHRPTDRMDQRVRPHARA